MPAHVGAGAGRLPPDLSRHLRDRAPQPGAADPLRDPERTRRRARRARLRAVDRHGRVDAARAGCRCSASTPTERPPTSTCSRSTSRPSSSTRTSSTASISPACPSATRTARPTHPLVIAGGHCAYNPEPLAEYVDAFVIGDGEEVISEIAEVVGAWKRGGRGVTRSGAARARDDRGRVRARDVRRRVRRPVHPCGHAALTPTCPPCVDKRTVADLGDWPYPKQQLVPLVEVVHDRLNVEIFRGCTRGCRFCQAGMITRPVRERPEEQVRTMVREGLRRTGYDEVALTSLSSADFSGIDGVVADLVNDQEGTGGVSVSLPSLRVDAFSVGDRERDPEGAPHRPHVRARGRLVAAAAGDQQARRRRRPLLRGRRRVLAGLAAGEALLPHRAAHRDGRRHARHRRRSPRT